MTKSTDGEISWAERIDAECEMIAQIDEEAAGYWRFWHLVGPPPGTKLVDLSSISSSRERFVTRRVTWTTTPQGHEYWAGIHYYLCDMFGERYSAKQYLMEKRNAETQRDQNSGIQ